MLINPYVFGVMAPAPLPNSLLRFTGANNSTSFIDDTSRVWTTLGDAKITTDVTAAAGVSGVFDGTGDTITTPYTTDLNLTGDIIFCIEGFIKPTAFSANMIIHGGVWTNTGIGPINKRQWIIACSATGSFNNLRVIYVKGGGLIDTAAAGPVMTAGAWQHFAVYRYGTGASRGICLAIDGVVTEFNPGDFFEDGGGVVDPINLCGVNDGTGTFYNGRYQGQRIYKGYSPYGGSNFTPPAPPFPTVNSDFLFANVALLLHCDGANNGTTFVDSSQYSRTMTAASSAVTSTTQVKFGTASGFFPNSSSRVTTPSAAQLELNAFSDWSIQCWVRITTPGSPITFVSKLCNNGISFQYRLYYDGTKIAGLIGNTTTNQILTSANNPTLNQFIFLELTRSGSNLYLFVDGTLQASGSNGLVMGAGNTQQFNIGNGGSNYYIDDIRITAGAVRNTVAYTPPTAAFPDN